METAYSTGVARSGLVLFLLLGLALLGPRVPTAVEAQAVPAPAASPSPACSPAPARPRLRFTGEVGLRAEYVANDAFAEDDSSRDDDHRFRERLRLRAGAEYDATPSLTAGFRLSTGDAAFPPSAWASFGDDFRRDPVSLDRAYVNWRVARSLELRLGAQANPLFPPSELVWDGDVQPAGVVEVLRFGESRLSFTAGQFMLREVRSGRPDNEANSFLLAQGLSWERPRPASRLTLGLSLYAYTDPDAIGRATQTGELSSEFRTNRFDPAGRRIPDPANPGRSVPVDLFSAYRTLGFDARFERTSPPLSVWGGLASGGGGWRSRVLRTRRAG